MPFSPFSLPEYHISLTVRDPKLLFCHWCFPLIFHKPYFAWSSSAHIHQCGLHLPALLGQVHSNLSILILYPTHVKVHSVIRTPCVISISCFRLFYFPYLDCFPFYLCQIKSCLSFQNLLKSHIFHNIFLMICRCLISADINEVWNLSYSKFRFTFSRKMSKFKFQI